MQGDNAIDKPATGAAQPAPKERARLRAAGAGLAHALLLWLAFPMFSYWPLDILNLFLWPLALVAVAPLMLLCARTERPWRDGMLAALGAMPFWFATHWWVAHISAAGVFPLVLYLSLWPGLFVALGAHLRRFVGTGGRHFVSLAVLWVGLEVVRGEVVFHGYPWHLIAHPLIRSPAAGLLASLVGAYGVGLVAALFSAMAAWSLADRSHRRRVLYVVVAALALALALADVSLRRFPVGGATGPEVRIALVQTEVPQDNKMSWTYAQRLADFGVFLDASRQARDVFDGGAADLIVWPETMFPGMTLDDASARVEEDAGLIFSDGARSMIFRETLLNFQRDIGVPMLVGAVAYEGLRIEWNEDGTIDIDADARFNSAMLIRGGRVDPGRYDKVHLTPFGEHMPYISRFPWLERRLLAIGARGMAFDLTAGRGGHVFEIGTHSGATVGVVTPICFEATMARVCRGLVFDGGVRRANVIAHLSNDGWFGPSRAGREAHLLATRWRAAELATPVVRAANTGISAVVDGRGRVTDWALIPEPGTGYATWTLRAQVHAAADGSATLYARTGDIVGWACAAMTGGACLLMLGAAYGRRHSKTRDRSDG